MVAGKLKLAKQFIIESVAEAKKVTWPKRQQLIEHSLIVIGALIVSFAVIAALDYGLSYLVKTYLFGV